MPDDSFFTPEAAAGTDANSRPASLRVSLIQGLEQIRERLHRQLSAVEVLARERLQQASHGLEHREQELERRTMELEQAEQRLHAQMLQWEQERQALVDQIERDRRLLAEAWERLEQEQIDHARIPQETRHVATVAPAAAMPSWPVPFRVPSAPEVPSTEDVLQQFQSLRRDVRRTTAESCTVY